MTGPAVRLLGAVAVQGTGGALPLGPSRQRTVLAVLLLSSGRPVTASELIERVWGSEPPPGAEQALRSYVCRLRQALEPTTAIRLERRHGGYAAAVTDGELDLDRVRALAVRARTAVRGGRLAEALSDLDQALKLSTDGILVGVGSEWLDEQRRLLDRELLAVRLERHDLALATGAPESVAADALARLTDEPYDERLAGQAVLALAGLGRTAEALEVFREVRRRLADELGIDPSPALRDIHERVLRGLDVVGAGSASPAATRSAVAQPLVPRQLPPSTCGFVDRVAESRALDRLLVDGEEHEPTVVVVSGPGGAGKTSLAVRWARQHSDRFPDGQLYVDLHGFDPDRRPTPPESALRALLAGLGVDQSAIPADLAGMVGTYRSLLADRRVLLLADDVGSEGQVDLLLPPGRGSATLLTSRSGLAGLVSAAGAHVLQLGLLEEAAARELLVRRLGSRRTTAEPAAVERLVSHCHGLPLALAIVSGRAAAIGSQSLSALADELADESRRLAVLSSGYCRADLAAVIAGSVATLSDAARSVLRWSAAGPHVRIRAATVAALAEVPMTRAEDLLRELVSIHLLEPEGQGEFRLHDLVRLAVRTQRAPGVDEAVDRLLDFLISDGGVGVRDVDDQVAAVAFARTTGRDSALCGLVDALERPLGSGGRWHELVVLNDGAVAAAERLGEGLLRVAALIGRGRGSIGLREFESAHADLAEALDLAVELADLGLQARAHRALARLGAHQHRWAAALHHDECGLDLQRRRGDLVGEAHAHNAVGWHLAHLDRAAESLASCRRALAIFTEVDDLEGQALTQDSIGYALDLLDRGHEALAAYRIAADLCGALNWPVVLANTLLRLADTAERLGDDREASAARGDAEEILRVSGRHVLEP